MATKAATWESRGNDYTKRGPTQERNPGGVPHKTTPKPQPRPKPSKAK